MFSTKHSVQIDRQEEYFSAETPVQMYRQEEYFCTKYTERRTTQAHPQIYLDHHSRLPIRLNGHYAAARITDGHYAAARITHLHLLRKMSYHGRVAQVVA